MQTFTARKHRVEQEFAKRRRWRLLDRTRQRAVIQIVAAEVAQCATVEEAIANSHDAIKYDVGLDPITMWLLGQILSAVIKAIWEWAHADDGGQS